MSSKLTHLVWGYKTIKVEDKLLLLALAELADRNGNFQTSITELRELTGMSDGVISTTLHHFMSAQVKLVRLNRRDQNSDCFSASLHIENSVANTTAHSQSAFNELDLLAQVQEQNERLQQNKQNNRGKLNRSQRAQIAPLHRPTNEKQYNVLEIHMEEIPNWAEGVMFKAGVQGRKDIWDSFVVDVHKTGEKIFTQTLLTNRLHQKIAYFKQQSFSNSQDSAHNRPVKQSALSDFEERYRDYLSDDDNDY